MRVNDITESVGLGGLEYEVKVFEAMRDSGVEGLDPGKAPIGGFSNQGSGDIEATYNGQPFNIEIKAGTKDQMGGTSIRADFDEDKYKIVNFEAVEEAAVSYYVAAAQKKKEDFKNWREHISQFEPSEINDIPNRIPFGGVTVEAWDSAQKEGLLLPLNAVETFENVNSVVKHYNKKHVHYIQLGGAGLFYLGQDILGLGVPALEAQMQIEFRLGPSGSKPHKKYDVRTRSAGYRAQGRLKSKIKSSHTLDDIDSIRDLFGK